MYERRILTAISPNFHVNQDFVVDVKEMFNVNLNTRANMNVVVIKFYDFRRVIFMLFREFNICAMYVRKIHLNCIMAFQIIRSIQKINVFKRIFLGQSNFNVVKLFFPSQKYVQVLSLLVAAVAIPSKPQLIVKIIFSFRQC